MEGGARVLPATNIHIFVDSLSWNMKFEYIGVLDNTIKCIKVVKDFFCTDCIETVRLHFH